MAPPNQLGLVNQTPIFPPITVSSTDVSIPKDSLKTV